MKKTMIALALFVALTVPVAAQELYVVHGINGSDLGLPAELPVDVVVGGGCLLTGFEFGSIEGPVPVDPGLYRVEIRLADDVNPCEGALVIEDDVSVSLGESASVVAQLTGESVIALTRFRNDVRGLDGNEARLIVRHAAAAPAVDVYAQQGSAHPFLAFAGLSSQDQGIAVIPAGSTTVSLTAAGTYDVVFGPGTGDAAGGALNIAYAVGSLDTGTFTLLIQAIDLP